MHDSLLRGALAARALAEIPKILTLLDRTPVSPTYGSFDRAYWHYRVMDFPSGMAQELVYPLALIWWLDLPDNPYRGSEAVRDWIEAGIRFAARSAHADGSCDDYFPFERAAGAAAFSLLACLGAAEIIELGEDAELDGFFRRRAVWLARHRESGQLSNHEALIVNCLVRMAERNGSSKWEPLIAPRLERLLSWQSEEGWFSEYGGADPGYLTLTIGLLADIDRRRPDLDLRPACRKAITFLSDFVHPDGTVGGEYASRATLNFFPHGFEIAGGWMKEALAINDRALRALAEGRTPCYSDDRIIGHHIWSWLLTWQNFVLDRPATLEPVPGRRSYAEARLLIDRRSAVALFVSLGKGGVFRLFHRDRLALADTGPAIRIGGRVAVIHIDGDYEVKVDNDHIVIEGRMAFAKTTRLTPFRSITLRAVMLVFGRFFPNLIRRILQRHLVTGRKEAPFQFRRELLWISGGWSIRDTIKAERGWSAVTAAGIGGFQTSTTTVMASVFQIDQLQPWLDLTNRIVGLADDEPLVVERTVSL